MLCGTLPLPGLECVRQAKGCVTLRDVSHDWTVWSDALLQPRGRTPVTHTAIALRSMSLHGADNTGARLAAQRTAGLSSSGSKHNIFTAIISVIVLSVSHYRWDNTTKV